MPIPCRPDSRWSVCTARSQAEVAGVSSTSPRSCGTAPLNSNRRLRHPSFAHNTTLRRSATRRADSATTPPGLPSAIRSSVRQSSNESRIAMSARQSSSLPSRRCAGLPIRNREGPGQHGNDPPAQELGFPGARRPQQRDDGRGALGDAPGERLALRRALDPELLRPEQLGQEREVGGCHVGTRWRHAIGSGYRSSVISGKCCRSRPMTLVLLVGSHNTFRKLRIRRRSAPGRSSRK